MTGVALRPQIIGLGPLLPEIQEDLDISHAVAGLLVTIPVLCMGLFAPTAPYVSIRLGSRFAIAGSLTLIGAFGIARLLTPEPAAVVLLTLGVGIGIALAGTLMPVAVAERFSGRPAFTTSVYTTGINTGAAIAAVIALPIANAAGGWRATMYLFSAFTIVLVGIWLVQTRHDRHRTSAPGLRPRPPIRSPIAWLLVLLFGLTGILFYGLTAWLPEAYIEQGWSEEAAAALFGVFNVAPLLTALPVAWMADRIGSRRRYLFVAAVGMLVGLLGVVLVPEAGFLWALIMGAANGVLFALVMTLPIDVAHRPEHVGAVAGMMLGIGYTIAAISPFLLGGVRDASGTFTGSLWILVGVSTILVLSTLLFSRERLRRGVGRQLDVDTPNVS